MSRPSVLGYQGLRLELPHDGQAEGRPVAGAVTSGLRMDLIVVSEGEDGRQAQLSCELGSDMMHVKLVDPARSHRPLPIALIGRERFRAGLEHGGTASYEVDSTWWQTDVKPGHLHVLVRAEYLQPGGMELFRLTSAARESLNRLV